MMWNLDERLILAYLRRSHPMCRHIDQSLYAVATYPKSGAFLGKLSRSFAQFFFKLWKEFAVLLEARACIYSQQVRIYKHMRKV